MPKVRRRIFDRVIIPGLIPSNITSVVSLGMNRPEWLKFILSSVIQNQYDLDSHSDLYKIIFDEKSGYLVQAFRWKKDAIENNFKSTAGYGIGFSQIEETVLVNHSVERLITDNLYDMQINLNRDNIDNFVDQLNGIFNYKIPKNLIHEKITQSLDFNNLNEEDIFSLYTWMIRQSLQYAVDDVVSFFSIINIYIHMIYEIINNENSNHNIYKNIFTHEKPGCISIELNNFEAALLLHEFIKIDSYRPITHSILLFQIISNNVNINNKEMDEILKKSYDLLPNKDEIQNRIKKTYYKILSNYKKYGSYDDLLTFKQFYDLCNVDDIKNVAILGEYNLITGDIEEILREFICYRDDVPYDFIFEDRWESYINEEEKYAELKKRMDLFIELIKKSIFYEDYMYTFQNTIIAQTDLLSWSEAIYEKIKGNLDYKTILLLLLRYSEENANVLDFKGKKITVQKLPTVVNPLIARGAMYEWMNVFSKIWD